MKKVDQNFKAQSPLFLRLFISFVFLSGCGESWVPQGDSQGDSQGLEIGEGCQTWQLQEKLQESQDPAVQLELIKSYLGHCEKDGFDSVGVKSLLELGMIKYDYQKSSQFQKLKISLSSGIRYDVYLGLKDRTTPRPMVILKSGVFAELDDPSVKLLLMFLFDESPFNVLVVPNVTGEEFQKENKIFIIGGLEEGYQLVELADFIRSSNFPYHSLVSSLHLVGLSLGGHSAIFAAIYDGQKKKPVFNSVFAGCPVVDLEAATRRIFQPSLIGYYFYSAFWKQLKNIRNAMIGLDLDLDLFYPSKRPTLQDVPDILADGSLSYYRFESIKRKRFDRPPFNKIRIHTRDDFWNWNRLQDHIHHLKVPLTLWAAQNDPVVFTDQNAALLEDQPQVRLLNSKKGGHCTFYHDYGWHTMGVILRTHILSNDPDFKNSMVKKTYSLDPITPFEGRMQSVRLKRGPKEKQILLSIKTKHKRFRQQGKKRTLQKFYRTNHFDLKILFEKKEGSTTNEVEKEISNRWLNANLRLLNAQGKDLQRGELPSSIEWYDFETDP